MHRFRRGLLGSVLPCLAALSLLAACGSNGSNENSNDESGGGTTTAPDDAGFQVPDDAWLLTVRYEDDPDSNDGLFLYLAYVPDTGETIASPLTMPRDGDPEWDDNPLTLSADYQWSLHDVVNSSDERDSGIVTIHPVGDGSQKSWICARSPAISG